MTPALVFLLTFSQAITEVRVEGNVRVADDTIREYASVTSQDDIPAAFRRVWDTGLFTDVRFELEDDVLVIHVEEKPVLEEYRFEGENVPVDDLTQALGLRPYQPFGEIERRAAEELAQELLGDAVRVEARTEVSNGLVSLVIALERVELETIEEIRFVGNEALSDSELRDAMQLKEKGWTTWITGRDELRESVLDADVERLRELYAAHGYLDAEIGPVEPGRIVTIPVVEGRPYTLDTVTVEPGSLLTRDLIDDWLPEAGGLYDETAIDDLVARLESYYQSRGYPAVKVVRERNVLPPDRVAVLLRVDEGSFFRVGWITFRGHERHRDRDLRQHLDLAESDRFNQDLLEQGVQSLSRLQTLAEVVPEVDLSTRPGRADITYFVQEVDRFEYLVGGGVTGVQGGTGNGQFIVRSLLGRGDVWRVDLDLGNRFQNFVASYRDPSTLGRRLFFSVDFARANLVFPDDTSEDQLDLAFRVGGPQGHTLQFITGFRASAFTLGSELEESVPFLSPFLDERFQTLRTNVTLAYEGRNQPVFPTRGTGALAGVELVTGDVEAVKARAQLSQLAPLSSRHLLAFAGRIEAVWPYGATETNGLPRFERLFLGTENDMRGFSIRGVGPRDENVVVGGDRLFYAAVEYQFVAHPRLRLVGFFDAGTVTATDFEGVPVPDIRYDAGGELQFLAPVWNLPLRIGYARNLDPVLDEDDGRFFVTLAVRF